MSPSSPSDALGHHAQPLKDKLVAVIKERHARAAEGHLASGSRYGMGFGTQWRDLLDDVLETLKAKGFPTHKLAPGGITVPVVNDCVVYVWRIPSGANAIANFALSPTRRDGFDVEPPEPMLFEPNIADAVDGGIEDVPDDLARDVRAVSGDAMPFVLVMVDSSPRLLKSIRWAIASLDDEGKVELSGEETIWQAEMIDDERAADEVKPFDAGAPERPIVEPHEQERLRTDG